MPQFIIFAFVAHLTLSFPCCMNFTSLSITAAFPWVPNSLTSLPDHQKPRNWMSLKINRGAGMLRGCFDIAPYVTTTPDFLHNTADIVGKCTRILEKKGIFVCSILCWFSYASVLNQTTHLNGGDAHNSRAKKPQHHVFVQRHAFLCCPVKKSSLERRMLLTRWKRAKVHAACWPRKRLWKSCVSKDASWEINRGSIPHFWHILGSACHCQHEIEYQVLSAQLAWHHLVILPDLNCNKFVLYRHIT